MDKIIIHGGKRLEGNVRISGAKNAALPVIVSSLLTDGWNVFHNVPDLADVGIIKRLLTGFGAQIEGDGTLKVNAGDITSCEAPYDLVKTMRASILVLGPLVARMGRARVSLPGGCAIGARPVNLHLNALQSMGAKIDLKNGYVEARASRLRGTTVYFDISTVTGTENIMMAATLAEGTTVLENAAREPEVINLANVLKGMGAIISGAGTDTIVIEGVETLRPVEATIIPDRIEAGTYMIAAGLTGGDVNLLGFQPNYPDAVITKLRETGMKITPTDEGLRVVGTHDIASVDVKTVPYPGFPTDLQAQIMVLMSLSQGGSVIRETVFENRFMHVNELIRMGADITVDGNSAIVRGVSGLCGAPVMATDLRASASLVLAGLVAKDTTEIARVYHIDRGYEHIEEKLSCIGADIERIKD
ncbi:MAG: UDP-N-acetylglucosamine 1-carboxyvinyltransferase [Thermodesulfobacteriota bacterium]|nr:UDP-N-acetylglucosamine 1-carboxyvinyltransferase [Thermodesulfobacteriota bacterium]